MSDNNLVSNKTAESDKILPNSSVFDHIFLVLDFMESDMKKLLKSDPPIPLEQDHVITILYNSLCALQFLHSANVIHRDIKPGNFLINSSCTVKLCDFGLSRTLSKKTEEERECISTKKQLYKRISRFDTLENYEESIKNFKVEMTSNIQNLYKSIEEKPRELSNCVVSRWYRAPEIILTQKRYD